MYPTVFSWGNNHVQLHFAHSLEIPPALLAVTGADDPAPEAGDLLRSALPVIEVALTDSGRHGTSGKRHIDGTASKSLRLQHWQEHKNNLTLQLAGGGLDVCIHFELQDGSSVVRTWSEITATTGPVTIDYLSSLVLSGLGHGICWEQDLALWQAANPWSGEFRWRWHNLGDLGLYDVGMVAYGQTGSKNRITATSTGAWSTSEMLPMGMLEDTRTGRLLAWQIENSGGWHYELGDRYDSVYVAVSGPTAAEHYWSQQLAPGETFRTAAASLAIGDSLEAVAAALTGHRRTIRRPHSDSSSLPVIYNDFLNGLMADPTTERELPLIDAAADLGVEIYCIDAGWYDDENGGWWDSVGEWIPSTNRFPDGGLAAVVDHIRGAGMLPGLWLEPEVVGTRSPLASQLPDDAFFQRDGHRLTEWGRHQLDLRHPAARAHLDATVDRLVTEFGLAYLKLDYNIDIGPGTDTRGNVGVGLLEHNRAHLAWVSAVMDRHPNLIVEGCSAGGSRLDAASGAVFPIQSLTDQQDFRLMPPIAGAAPLTITPEQSGVWASVDPSMTDEQLAFAMTTALLSRIHLAGRPDNLAPTQRQIVRAALEVYRSIRADLAVSTPVWPTGLPGWRDGWVSAGRRTGNDLLLAVWRRDGEPKASLPLPEWLPDDARVEILYPSWADAEYDLVTRPDGTRALDLALPLEYSARLFRLTSSSAT